MKKFVSTVKRLLHNEDGASIVEYGLLIGLIALACVTTITALGGSFSGFFSTISGAVNTANGVAAS